MNNPANFSSEPLLKVRDVSKTFILGKSVIRQMLGRRPDVLRAVHHVNLDIYPGECLGLVGESGCGKTTLGRCILRLYEPDGGQVFFDDQEILELNVADMNHMRRKMQIVFQDPYSSLNPRIKVGEMLKEASLVHGIVQPNEADGQVEYLLNMVGLSPDISERFPHELSGGQRQRVGLARALAVDPTFIVADEPISALDVSIQAQVINLLVDLQEKLHLTMLFITHDLRLVRYVSHRVAVMYLGSIVELAPVDSLFSNPLHPYSRALLAAAPMMNPRNRSRVAAIKGEPPNPINIPSGKCPFLSRCELARDRCSVEEPQLVEVEPGHFVSCFAVKG